MQTRFRNPVTTLAFYSWKEFGVRGAAQHLHTVKFVVKVVSSERLQHVTVQLDHTHTPTLLCTLRSVEHQNSYVGTTDKG